MKHFLPKIPVTSQYFAIVAAMVKQEGTWSQFSPLYHTKAEKFGHVAGMHAGK